MSYLYTIKLKLYIMKFFNILKNDQIIASSLTETEANNKFLGLIEEHTNGYIYDNETETVFNEVDKRVVAELNDTYVVAGDDKFEIIEDLD